MKIIELAGTCDASGDLVLTAATPEIGRIEKIVMVYDDGATGTDIVVTNEDLTVSEPILTAANVGVADVVWYPRTLANKVADGSAFTDIAEKIFVTGKMKIVVDEGGTSKNFRFVVFLTGE